MGISSVADPADVLLVLLLAAGDSIGDHLWGMWVCDYVQTGPWALMAPGKANRLVDLLLQLSYSDMAANRLS